jgi:WD40-like Beta Propeller Repeat
MSPDGQRLALEVTEGSGTDIWVYDWQRDTMTRLTFAGIALDPVWSPDSRYVAFRTVGEGMSVTRSDGAGKPQPLTQSKNIQYPWSFTPDGKRLSFIESSGGEYHLWTVPLESDSAGLRAGKPEVFLQTQADERALPFLPTADGWPTLPMSRGRSKFTFELSRTRAGNGKSRTATARTRCGRAMDMSFFSRLWITTSWWRRMR